MGNLLSARQKRLAPGESKNLNYILVFFYSNNNLFFSSNSTNSKILSSIKTELAKNPCKWRILGVYSLIEDLKATAAAVTTGHCFPVRLTGEKLESVDRQGSVCQFLQTDKEKYGFEEYDFESKTAVFLMIYKKGIFEFRQ